MDSEIDEIRKRLRICKAKLKLAHEKKVPGPIKAKIREELYSNQDKLAEYNIAKGIEANRLDFTGLRFSFPKIEEVPEAPELEIEAPITWL